MESYGQNCLFAFNNVSEGCRKTHLNWQRQTCWHRWTIESKHIRMVADIIALAICHIVNLCFNESVCPSKWKIAKLSFSGEVYYK